jgi:hypothetical protein
MANTISCKNCDGQMEITARPKHNQGLGFFMIILGVISTFFLIVPFGILLLGIGIYICNSKESIWLCNSCKTAISRAEV